jgi:tRNA (uracil-5-)-methyltransferase
VSKNTTGLPFRPVKAIAVDLFPHTDHTELIVLFQRVDVFDEKA